MNVVLIGYRATGKSTVGKHVAFKLNLPFFDTDTLVEKKVGMSIADIVAKHGWDFFRAREKETVQSLENQSACVISTGGGVVLDEENISSLKKNGFLVWLNAPLNNIVSRLNGERPEAVIRPQFTDWNIVEETIKMVNERYPLYEKAADYTVETANKNIVKVGEDIYQYLVESGKLIMILKKTNK
ncbi:MAG TPA: shikimate kinase [Deltaproteobacteria bacterium]|nr:shikimate kinase [Deltaproteobacteria bacterium]